MAKPKFMDKVKKSAKGSGNGKPKKNGLAIFEGSSTIKKAAEKVTTGS